MERVPVLLTPTEVAEIVRQSPETVRRWAREGLLPSVPMPGGRIRFRRADVDALVSGDKAAS